MLTKPQSVAAIVQAYLIFIVLGIPTGLLNVGWISMSTTFEVTVESLGILLLASTSGYLLASFFNGQFINRLDVRPTLILSSVIAGIGLLGYTLIPSWPLLLIVAFVTSLGSGTIDAALNVYFAQHYSPRLMNWLHAAFGLGAVIGPIMMTAILSRDMTWRWGYGITAVLMLAMGFSLVFTKVLWRSSKPENMIDGETREKDFSLLASLRHPMILLGILLFFIYAGIEVTAPQWGYPLFTEGRGMNIETAGVWVSFYWATFTFGRLVFGFVADRVPLVQTIRICMLVIVFGAVLVWQDSILILNSIGLAIMGFALAPIFPLLISDTPKRLGPGHANNAIGFQVSAASFGIGILPGLAGILTEQFSLEIIGPYLVVVSILLLLIYQAISSRNLRESQHMATAASAEV